MIKVLARFRVSAGYTQGEAVAKLRRSRPWLVKKENEPTTLTVGEVGELAELYHTDTLTLLQAILDEVGKEKKGRQTHESAVTSIQ